MKIQIAESIKGEIAEKIAEQASPGYSKDVQGEWYVVDGVKVVHAERTRPWDPWHDDAKVVSVEDLVWYCGGAQEENADFDPSVADDIEGDTQEAAWERAVEFALGYVPDAYDTADLPYEDA